MIALLASSSAAINLCEQNHNKTLTDVNRKYRTWANKGLNDKLNSFFYKSLE